MIDLKATNKKLQQRSKNIIRTICGTSAPKRDDEMDALIASCNGSVKLAVATVLLQTSVNEAKLRLESSGGVLAKLLTSEQNIQGNPANGSMKLSGGYVLCIDGGGSKCAAVILGKNGEEGRGEAGGCNV